MASSDLEQSCSHINEKIANIKRTLLLRNCGQEPTLKTTLDKIGDEIIVVNELLKNWNWRFNIKNKPTIHSRNSESLEEDYKDVEHLKENIPPHLPQVTVSQNFANVSDLDPEEPKLRKLYPQRSPQKNKEVLKKCRL